MTVRVISALQYSSLCYAVTLKGYYIRIVIIFLYPSTVTV